jgi:ADP-glucose pyrophosphorylase
MNALPYVIILAGGEGQRLAPLTRALYGTGSATGSRCSA